MEFLEYIDESINELETELNINEIESNGFTVRYGNKVCYFTKTSEQLLPEDDLKKDYIDKYNNDLEKLKTVVNDYKENLLSAYQIKIKEYDEKINEYNEKINRKCEIPIIYKRHNDLGLSVVLDNEHNNDILWYFNCVYSPKYVNNRRIEPSFAKRLLTPITILIKTTNYKVYSIKVLKIIGHEKFQHYHSLTSSSDCWGDFKYNGVEIYNADQALDFARKVLLLLDTINEYSIGKRNPKGLSRFDTIKKHLLDETNIDPKKVRNSSKHTRSGFNIDVNDHISDNMVWSTS
jgi:hypothetical protein